MDRQQEKLGILPPDADPAQVDRPSVPYTVQALGVVGLHSQASQRLAGMVFRFAARRQLRVVTLPAAAYELTSKAESLGVCCRRREWWISRFSFLTSLLVSRPFSTWPRMLRSCRLVCL